MDSEQIFHTLLIALVPVSIAVLVMIVIIVSGVAFAGHFLQQLKDNH